MLHIWQYHSTLILAFVAVKRLENLQWKRLFLTKTPNLYVEVKLGADVKTTRTVKKSSAPVWDEELTLYVYKGPLSHSCRPSYTVLRQMASTHSTSESCMTLSGCQIHVLAQSISRSRTCWQRLIVAKVSDGSSIVACMISSPDTQFSVL